MQRFVCVEGVMKKVLFAAAIAMTAGTAMAADLQRPSYYAPGTAPAPFNWVGPYAGLNLGYQWGSVSHSPTDPSGVFGGGQLGYNWQNGRWVYGLETDLQLSGADDTAAGVQFENNWWGSTRGRVGYTWNAFMFYGTLGLAYGDVKAHALGVSETRTQLGWATGLGVEVGLNRAWSAKIEYLYTDLGDRHYSVTGTNNGLWSNMLRLGVNYHF
jgi:outer membrane immunogenic protein